MHQECTLHRADARFYTSLSIYEDDDEQFAYFFSKNASVVFKRDDQVW